LTGPSATFNGPLNLPPLSTPASVTPTSIAGGALGAFTAYVRITIVASGGGETLASPETSLAVAASRLLVVGSPARPAGSPNAIGWNVYVSTTSGAETKQNTSTLAFGASWTEPTTGLIVGNALPIFNTSSGDVTVGGILSDFGSFAQSANVATYVPPNANGIAFRNAANTQSIITFNDSGSITAAGYTTGSSTYGPTSASINGPLTCSGWNIGLSGANSTLTFPSGGQGVFYCGATPIALFTSTGNLQFAAGTFSGPTFTIVPANASGYVLRNAANTTSPMTVSDSGALKILGQGTQPGSLFWSNPSDVRLKHKIEPHTDGLAHILALRPIAFEYNGLGGIEATGKRYVGLSAQELKSIIPRAVSSERGKIDGEETDILTIDASEILFTLINAVQELAAQIASPPPKKRPFITRIFGL